MTPVPAIVLRWLHWTCVRCRRPLRTRVEEQPFAYRCACNLCYWIDGETVVVDTAAHAPMP